MCLFGDPVESTEKPIVFCYHEKKLKLSPEVNRKWTGSGPECVHFLMYPPIHLKKGPEMSESFRGPDYIFFLNIGLKN